jgi:hypothetical protein
MGPPRRDRKGARQRHPRGRWCQPRADPSAQVSEKLRKKRQQREGRGKVVLHRGAFPVRSKVAAGAKSKERWGGGGRRLGERSKPAAMRAECGRCRV